MWMNDLARRVVPTALALAVSALAAPGARAADEEIQVYMDEIGPVGAVGLDLHLNYVPAGRTLPDYPGGQVSEGRFRLTPEWSYAVSPNVELGAYLPLTTIDRHGMAEIGGRKSEVNAGDFMGFVAGSAPHTMANPFKEDLVYLVGGTRHAYDVVDYPRRGIRSYKYDGKRDNVLTNNLGTDG